MLEASNRDEGDRPTIAGRSVGPTARPDGGTPSDGRDVWRGARVAIPVYAYRPADLHGSKPPARDGAPKRPAWWRPRLPRSRWARLLPIAVVAIVIVLVLIVRPVLGYATRPLPAVDQVFSSESFQSAMIYDRKGRLLYEMFDPQGGKRSVVLLSRVPRVLIDATIATEDASFYTNPGVDPGSILRAFVRDLAAGRVTSGASTITQQLVRNVIMTPPERRSQSLSRKLGEAILAFRVSQRYTKDEILQRYLNEIYYGNLAYGVESASETYFDKPVEGLTLAEAALIAGLPQGPALYDPFQYPDAAKERQRAVLALMVKHGAITRAQADAAVQEPLNYHARPSLLLAPHFVMYVRNLLEDRFSRDQLYRGGLRVYTTLDLDLQHQAETLVGDAMPTLHGNDASDAALVAIDPATGDILALVGSADYGDSAIQGQVDLATAERQPGATIAPFVYLAALDHHQATLATTLHDAPTQYSMGAGQPPYEPKDDDGKFRGPVTARRALATSLTVPTVELLNQIGVDPLLTLLRQLGIGTLGEPASHYGLSLALGGEPVRLLDLTYAYAALANRGVQAGEPAPNPAPGDGRFDPVAILKVTDPTGRILSDRGTPAGFAVVSPDAAWLVTNVLADDASRAERLGAHSPLELPDRPSAARAATSASLKDAWAFGYTPRLAVGVWVGNADGTPMKHAFGLDGPAKLWHDFVEAALAGQPPVDFARPPGLVQVKGEWFILGTQPATTVALPTVPVQASAPATGPSAPAPGAPYPAPPAPPKPAPPKNGGRGHH